MSGSVSAPRHLTSDHDVSGFDCAVPELNDWLKRRALQNESTRASRTFVVIGDGRVVGYYALATGAVAHAVTTGKVRRNMPEPIPVMVVVRLAVDRTHQGTGLGSALLRDALLRTLTVAETVGIRAILLHAISEEAKRFYLHHGFAESPVDPMTMMITVAVVETALGIARAQGQ
ncbi:MAG: GNAT family N-acetyltransferase [Betaproteobacteria bacterium]|nr:GNAT family N-acetyltransferase [Betaproteobacteria bacterium]